MCCSRAGEELRLRLERVQGPLGDALRRAEELSTVHGLIEVRPLIAAAAERADMGTLDVGVFGRVSSGKSSLINAIVGHSLLPVGATPATAVPLRVIRGEAEIRVRFADRHEEVIDPSSLANLATETGNPDNRRGVASILVRSPTVLDGLTLLDTPGVGSMSQSGPSQAFAWLPRCDLGLVLVAAGTPVGRDELALVAGLALAGIAVEVLVSKSDQLDASELESATEYVRRELRQAAGGGTVAVRPVSVESSSRHLLDSWMADELMPMVAARHRLVVQALARRLRAIVSSLDSGVRHRTALDASTIDRHRHRLEAQRKIESAVNELQEAAAATIEAAATAAAQAWRNGSAARAAVRNALLEPPSRTLATARTAADGSRSESEPQLEEQGHRIPPLFDPAFLDALPIDDQPGAFDRLFARRTARRQLVSLTGPVSEAYGIYANRVRAWALQRLEERSARPPAPTRDDGDSLAPQLRPLAALIEHHFPVPRDE